MEEKSLFETAILEKLIVKTGMLLALGFGEAGANIIAENMRKGILISICRGCRQPISIWDQGVWNIWFL